jgi:hypothetical protein
MHVDGAVMRAGDIERNLDMRAALVWSGLVEGYPADLVGTVLHDLAQKSLAAGIADDALLGKGDDVQFDQIGVLRPDVQQCLERGQAAAGVDVNMGAHSGNAVGNRRPNDVAGARDDVFARVTFLARTGDLDRLIEGAADIHRDTVCEHHLVEMDMGLDEARHAEATLRIDDCLTGRVDGVKGHIHAAGYGEVGWLRLPLDSGVADDQVFAHAAGSPTGILNRDTPHGCVICRSC